MHAARAVDGEPVGARGHHRDRPAVLVGELAERGPRVGALRHRTDRDRATRARCRCARGTRRRCRGSRTSPCRSATRSTRASRSRSARRGTAPARATSAGYDVALAETAGRNSNQQHRDHDPDPDREQRRREETVDAVRQAERADRRTGAPSPHRRSCADRQVGGLRSSTPTTPADDRDRQPREAGDSRSPRRRRVGRAPRSRDGCVARKIATISVMHGLLDVEALHDVAGDADEQQRAARATRRGAARGAHPTRGTRARPRPGATSTAAASGTSIGANRPQRAEPAGQRDRHRRREVDHARERDRGGGDAPRAAPHGRRVTGRRPGDGARMACDDLGRPRRPDALAGGDPLQPRELGQVAHAVPEPRVQLGARLELDPRAPQPLRRTPAAGPHAAGTHSTTRPPLPTVRVERAAAEVGELRATGVARSPVRRRRPRRA